MRYEAGRALAALAPLSPAAELAHRRFADFYWDTGEWPSTSGGGALGLARVGAEQWAAVLTELTALGWREHKGRLSHLKVQRVRGEALGMLRVARETGRVGANRRWSPRRAIGSLWGPHGDRNGDPMPVHGKQYSTSTNALNPAERLKESEAGKADGSALSGSAQEKGAGDEKRFLEEVREMLELWKPTASKRELENWGGWWRNRFRENPRKAAAVLADIRSLVRERRISQTPGQAAVDLWKRLP